MKSVGELWSYTLKELRLMTVTSCWELIFCQCFPLPPEGDLFVLGTRSRYVLELMELRWHKLPEDVLSCVVDRPVQVKCVLLD